jgi:hypothetical protein
MIVSNICTVASTKYFTYLEFNVMIISESNMVGHELNLFFVVL